MGELPTFRIMMIYEDLDSGKCARHCAEKVLNALNGDCRFYQNLWSFDALAIPEVRDIAASAAAAADIVILSMSGERALSAEIKDWIEMWVWLVDRTHPAVVALFKHPHCESRNILAYLHHVTARKQLNIFPDSASYLIRDKATHGFNQGSMDG